MRVVTWIYLCLLSRSGRQSHTMIRNSSRPAIRLLLSGRCLQQACSYHISSQFGTSKMSKQVSPASLRSAASNSEVLEFTKVFPDIVQDLTETGQHLDVPAVNKRFAKVLQYNMTGGKMNRGLAVVLAYKLLAQESEITPDNIELAHIMGWCIEMLNTSVMMIQDTLHGARERRGKPCWHLSAAIGIGQNGGSHVACNDASLLQTGLYHLLRIYFRSCPYYLDVLELFHDVSHKAIMGLVMDVETRSDKSLEKFTMERYQAITKYKTAYLTFQTPVSLALYMANINDPEVHRQAKTILMEMGQFYQVLDDYLNCYGDPALTSRIGTDIEDGKCTWLSVVALQRLSLKDQKIMKDNYGSKDPEKVAVVKKLYDNLNLPATYAIYQQQTYDLLCTQIQQVSRGLPHKLFLKFLDQIYVKDA